MKRVVCVFFLALLLTPVFAQELNMAGTWELYRLDTIGTFSLNEFRASPTTDSFVDARLVLNADGSMTTDSLSLRFLSWGIDEGFLYFETPSGNSFYKVRDLSDDVYFLVSVVVTERNATVTQIEANANANLILVRTQ
jgi:hypothetical protein